MTLRGTLTACAVVILLAGAPGASAQADAAQDGSSPEDPVDGSTLLSPDDDERGEGGGEACTNYGVIVMVGIGNTFNCWGEGECANQGVLIMVGPGNEYNCVNGQCSNDGLVVNVGGTYCGQDSVYCLGAYCWPGCWPEGPGKDPLAEGGAAHCPVPEGPTTGLVS